MKGVVYCLTKRKFPGYLFARKRDDYRSAQFDDDLIIVTSWSVRDLLMHFYYNGEKNTLQIDMTWVIFMQARRFALLDDIGEGEEDGWKE